MLLLRSVLLHLGTLPRALKPRRAPLHFSILAILQLYAALSSLSLSIFGTACDSVFDPLANFVLLYCHKKAEHVDYRKYPSGGSKFETIGQSSPSSFPLAGTTERERGGSESLCGQIAGDIVYSGVMGAVSLILVVRPSTLQSPDLVEKLMHRRTFPGLLDPVPRSQGRRP